MPRHLQRNVAKSVKKVQTSLTLSLSHRHRQRHIPAEILHSKWRTLWVVQPHSFAVYSAVLLSCLRSPNSPQNSLFIYIHVSPRTLWAFFLVMSHTLWIPCGTHGYTTNFGGRRWRQWCTRTCRRKYSRCWSSVNGTKLVNFQITDHEADSCYTVDVCHDFRVVVGGVRVGKSAHCARSFAAS